MVTIDNYSFVCIENTKMRLAKPNEMNDSRRKIVIVGTCDNGKEKSVKVIEVQHYEKTYIIGNYNSYNSTYFLGKKSREMKKFENMVREGISIITNFMIGYAYKIGAIGKHIPCIIGKVDYGQEEKVIFIESQEFRDNIITDINGKKYFIDWLSMSSWQYRKMIEELQGFPTNLKKNFGTFGEKGLKMDMIALNNYLPILGVAGAFEIK